MVESFLGRDGNWGCLKQKIQSSQVVGMFHGYVNSAHRPPSIIFDHGAGLFEILCKQWSVQPVASYTDQVHWHKFQTLLNVCFGSC